MGGARSSERARSASSESTREPGLFVVADLDVALKMDDRIPR